MSEMARMSKDKKIQVSSSTEKGSKKKGPSSNDEDDAGKKKYIFDNFFCWMLLTRL